MCQRRILLTIPITYLHSGMNREGLNNVALISIERGTAVPLEYSEMLHEFSNIEAHKISFVIF